MLFIANVGYIGMTVKCLKSLKTKIMKVPSRKLLSIHLDIGLVSLLHFLKSLSLLHSVITSSDSGRSGFYVHIFQFPRFENGVQVRLGM